MPVRHKMHFRPVFPTLARLQDSREKGCSGIFHCSRGSLSVGLMTRRTRNTTTSAVLDATVMPFWLGGAQEVEVMSAGETALPAATAGGAATSDFGRAARYYQQSIQEKALGQRDPEYATSLTRYAFHLHKPKRKTEAAELSVQARDASSAVSTGLPPAKQDRSFPSAHSLSFGESR
jgi:hypothetical protein